MRKTKNSAHPLRSSEKKVTRTKKVLKMQNFMFKCSELASNLKQNHYFMVKKRKKKLFYFSKCVCATVLKQFLIF